MADVFVSHARADKARVAPLVAAIEGHGLSEWWGHAISPGEEFDRLIVAQLDVAAAVLVEVATFEEQARRLSSSLHLAGLPE